MNNNMFKLNLLFYLSVQEAYDYTISYMENLARNFIKKYPSSLLSH